MDVKLESRPRKISLLTESAAVSLGELRTHKESFVPFVFAEIETLCCTRGFQKENPSVLGDCSNGDSVYHKAFAGKACFCTTGTLQE